jgi:Flp pilus assembly pilin Flp
LAGGCVRIAPPAAASRFVAVKSSGKSKRKMYRFLEEEQGQDMIEYTLLLAFIALAGAVLFIGMGTNINSIWTVVNSRLASAGSGQ